VAERIRTEVQHVNFDDLVCSSYSVSVGGVTFRSRNSFDDLFRAADGRLYAAKKGGRNLVFFERGNRQKAP